MRFVNFGPMWLDAPIAKNPRLGRRTPFSEATYSMKPHVTFEAGNLTSNCKISFEEWACRIRRWAGRAWTDHWTKFWGWSFWKDCVFAQDIGYTSVVTEMILRSSILRTPKSDFSFRPIISIGYLSHNIYTNCQARLHWWLGE